MRFYIFMYALRDIFKADIFHDEEWKYNFTLHETYYARYVMREKFSRISIFAITYLMTENSHMIYIV